MIYSWRNWSGLIPRLLPSRLPEAHAQTAISAGLSRGDLRPTKATSTLFSITTAVRSLFTLDGQNFLSWDRDVDAVRGPVLEDQYKRVYFTDTTGLWMTFRDQASVGGGEPATKYRAGVPQMPTPTLVVEGGADAGVTLAVTFFYEAAGVKYQETSVSLTTITAGEKYSFTPPAKNVASGETTPGVPATAAEEILITGWSTRTADPNAPGGYTEAWQYLNDAVAVQITSPETVLRTDTSDTIEAYRIQDRNGAAHEVATLYSMVLFTAVSDAGVTVTGGETAPNASQTPSGYTPDNAMPIVHVVATREGETIFDVYSAGSSFNTTDPVPRVTLEAGTTQSGTEDERHYTNFTTLFDNGGRDRILAYLYTRVNSGTISWYQRYQNTILANQFGGDETARNNWVQEGDLAQGSLTTDEAARLQSLATTATQGTVGIMYLVIDYEGTSSGIVETRAYIVTAVNEYHEEGPPSEHVLVTVNLFQKVKVTCTLPSVTGVGGFDFAPIYKIRLYRTAQTTTVETDYFKVFDQDIADGLEFYDETKSSELSPDTCESWEWEAAPAGMTGLTYLGNGILAGITLDMEVALSEPYRPHAWPRTYFHSFPSMPVRIMPQGNSHIITTRAYPYLLTGSEPGSMVEQRLTAMQAAVSKRAHADLGGVIAYASNDGIVLVSGGVASLDSSLLLWGREKWRDLYREKLPYMEFAAHDGMLLAFWGDDRGFMVRFDEGGGALTEVPTAGFTGAFVLAQTDSLYIGKTVNGSHGIGRFAGDTVNDTMTWHSRDLVLPKPYNMGALQVSLESGSVGVTVYADGAVVYTGTCPAGVSTHRLSTSAICRFWSVKLVGDGIVREMHLANTVQELRAV